MSRENSFVGTGWNWPVATDPTGAIALSSGTEELEQAMYLVLATTPGERPMRPEFGCAIADRVFGGADATTAGRIAYEVRRALDRWEPRIDVHDVAISFDERNAGTIYIDVRYAIRGANDPRNLVFPFYLIPEETPAVEPSAAATGPSATVALWPARAVAGGAR
jgi:uncharacterized protein